MKVYNYKGFEIWKYGNKWKVCNGNGQFLRFTKTLKEAKTRIDTQEI